MAKIIRADGSTQEIRPENGTNFRLKEAQEIVGGTVEVIDLPDGNIMIANDESKILDLPRNEQATRLANFPTVGERNMEIAERRARGEFIIDATDGEEDYVAGDVLVCKDEEFR